jgi:hypothetical protein
MDASLFTAEAPEQRTVVLADGTSHDLHFRSAPTRLWRLYILADARAETDAWENAVAALIAATVCEPDGTPAMTIEQALRLKPIVTQRFLAEIALFNGAAGKD